MMFVHICRKVIYGLDISYRICFYMLGTLLISVVSDYKTSAASKSYFADPDNLLNQWFVKLGWLWTASLLGGFIYLTCSTFSCGRAGALRSGLTRWPIPQDLEDQSPLQARHRHLRLVQPHQLLRDGGVQDWSL